MDSKIEIFLMDLIQGYFQYADEIELGHQVQEDNIINTMNDDLMMLGRSDMVQYSTCHNNNIETCLNINNNANALYNGPNFINENTPENGSILCGKSASK